MRRLMILNLFIIGTIFSTFAQKTIEVYDINEDQQTTVIIRDAEKSDKDILSELDLDDYTVGEEVYITAEMWKEMQEEKEKKNEPKINESPKKEKAENIVVKEEVVVQEKVAEKPARATKVKSSSSSKAKKKKKKSKRYRIKKAKRRKYTSRRGKMACYSF